MDPLSHVLLGRTISRLRPPLHDTPGCEAACILGALAPDLDILIAPFGWDRYLAVHETATHALCWSPMLALAAAAVAQRFSRPARVRDLWAPAWLGVAAGHLLFDLVSGSTMRLLSPLLSERWGPQWLAMADALAVGVLVAGTLAGFWRRRLAAAVTIAALIALVMIKAVSQAEAADAFERTRGMMAVHPAAVNGSLALWTFFERDGQRIRAWRVDAWTGTVSPLFTWTDAADDSLVRATRSAPVVQRMFDLARDPFARVETRPDGVRQVLWSDIRYCSAAACYLSFGVEVDARGQLLRQVVRLGPLTQSRPLR